MKRRQKRFDDFLAAHLYKPGEKKKSDDSSTIDEKDKIDAIVDSDALPSHSKDDISSS